MLKAQSDSISYQAAWSSVAEYGLLIAVILLAGCLRFFRLGEWSLWGDEIFSLGSKPDGFVQSTTTQLIHWATALLGTSEWSARLVPALIGTVSIVLLYFPIRKLFGVPVAMLSSALLAVSPWHIYWSQNARFYVLLLLFYTLALTFFIGWRRIKPLYCLVVFFGLAKERMLAGISSGQPALPLSIQFLPFDRGGFRLRNLAIFYGPLILLGMVFAWPFLLDIPGWLRGFSRINTNPFWLFSGTVYYIGLPIVLLAATGAVYFLMKRSRAALYLSLGATIPLAVILLSSLFQYSANRYAFVSLTSWIILAALACAELLTSLSGSLRIFAVGLVVVLLATSLSEDILYFQYQNGNRENWKAAFEFIQENRKPGEPVVIERPELGLLSGRRGGQYWQMDKPGILQHERVWFIEDMNVEVSFRQLVWVKITSPAR
jgi:4-amino-4-deoxy-L-arabinose transferase-like glycosyltransferase